jgi:hypothetical protein
MFRVKPRGGGRGGGVGGVGGGIPKMRVLR